MAPLVIQNGTTVPAFEQLDTGGSWRAGPASLDRSHHGKFAGRGVNLVCVANDLRDNFKKRDEGA